MSRRFWYGLTLVLSLIWAVGIWAGHELLMIASHSMQHGSIGWTAYPEVQGVLAWLAQLVAGLSGVLQVIVVALWALGQGCLVLLLWLGLKYGTQASVAALAQKINSRLHDGLKQVQ